MWRRTSGGQEKSRINQPFFFVRLRMTHSSLATLLLSAAHRWQIVAAPFINAPCTENRPTLSHYVCYSLAPLFFFRHKFLGSRVKPPNNTTDSPARADIMNVDITLSVEQPEVGKEHRPVTELCLRLGLKLLY